MRSAIFIFLFLTGVVTMYALWVFRSPHWLGSSCQGDLCFSNAAILTYSETVKAECGKRGGYFREGCRGLGCEIAYTQCEVIDPTVCSSYGGKIPSFFGSRSCEKQKLNFLDRLRDAPYTIKLGRSR